MRKSFSTSCLTLGLLALAACGKSVPEQNGAGGAAAIDPTKAAAEMAFQFQPGKYRTTIAIHKVEVPGMPAGFGEQMKSAMSRNLTNEHCISREQAAQGVEAMKQHLAQGKCQFESFNARAGKVVSVFTCEAGGGTMLRSSSHGTYSPTGSQVATKAEMKGPGGKAVQIEQTVTTTRIGECG